MEFRSCGSLSGRDFLVKFYTAAYKARSLICSFNQPFDSSRLAFRFSNARDRFTGGFSLALWDYVDNNGQRRKISIGRGSRSSTSTVNARSKVLPAAFEPDPVDQIPEGSRTGEPDGSHKFRGHFLDLRTLAFVLTDRGHTLASACEAFGVKQGKGTVDRHGVVSAVIHRLQPAGRCVQQRRWHSSCLKSTIAST